MRDGSGMDVGVAKPTSFFRNFYVPRHILNNGKFITLNKEVYMDLPECYDENRTIAEMAQISGKTKNIIRFYCWSNKLKYKPARENIPEWYDPSLSMSEMANKAGKSLNAIAKFLRNHSLKCKSAMSHDTPSWYNENMNLAEMAELANKPRNAIIKYLRYHDLPYKKKKFIKSKGYRKKYSFEEFMKFYDKNLTAKEMSMLSNIPEKNVRKFLNSRKLEYYRVCRQLEIGDWYDPSLKLGEMSFASGIAKDDLISLLRRKRLPYNKVNHTSKVAVL